MRTPKAPEVGLSPKVFNRLQARIEQRTTAREQRERLTESQRHAGTGQPAASAPHATRSNTSCSAK